MRITLFAPPTEKRESSLVRDAIKFGDSLEKNLSARRERQSETKRELAELEKQVVELHQSHARSKAFRERNPELWEFFESLGSPRCQQLLDGAEMNFRERAQYERIVSKLKVRAAQAEQASKPKIHIHAYETTPKYTETVQVKDGVTVRIKTTS